MCVKQVIRQKPIEIGDIHYLADRSSSHYAQSTDIGPIHQVISFHHI